MRPFIRPTWQADWSRHVLVDIVFDQLGRFCAACDRPLTVGCFLYEPTTGRLIGGRANAAGFADALPLCDNCASAAIGTEATVANATSAVGPLPAGEVLRPDRDLTFTLGTDSPLRYERRTVDVDGEPTELVLVVAGDSRGAATVEHYALNSVYGDQPTPTRLRFPIGFGLAYPDPRLELRTRAWDQAVSTAALLLDPDPAVREPMITHARIALRYCGFWSVWATVLANAFPGSDLLARLLLPPRRASARSRLDGLSPARQPPPPGFAGPDLTGHAGDFPGTRTEWLGGAR